MPLKKLTHTHTHKFYEAGIPYIQLNCGYLMIE